MAAKAITVASPWGSVHATLVAATQDVITITGLSESYRIEVKHRAGGSGFYVTGQGTDAVDAAAGTLYIAPGESFAWEPGGPGVTVLKIISAGTDSYSVHAVTQGAWL